MKILFISDNFPPERNASASRVYERALYWVNWGHEITVVTGAPNFPEGKVFDGYRNHWYAVEEMGGIRVVRVKTFIAANQGIVRRTIDFASFMMSASVAGLFQERPDVIVATSPQFFAAIAGDLVAWARRIPFVFELSDLWPASIKAVDAMRSGLALRSVEKLELSLYRHAARVVALTRSFKHDLVERGIPAEKIAVVVNGVDVARFSPQPRNLQLARELGIEDSFVVGYIGTHGMAHALEKVLDAAELTADLSAIRFLFVGTGAARANLLREAQRRGLKNVIFVPAQPKERMIDYWSLCNVALVHLKNTPLFSTVIPSKIFEAMAMGLPILVAAPEGEATAIVRADRAGLVIEPENPVALADAARDLYLNPERRDGFARNSLRAALSHSREKQALEMIELLNAAAAGQAPPAKLVPQGSRTVD